MVACAAIGYFVGKDHNSRVKTIELDDGSEIGMWRGFVDPSYIHVCHGKDGDGVMFDSKGNITDIFKNVK